MLLFLELLEFQTAHVGWGLLVYVCGDDNYLYTLNDNRDHYPKIVCSRQHHTGA